MDNVAPPSPPATPPAGPVPAAKPKPPGGAIQTPKRIAANLDKLKEEFAANPPPPAPASKPRGRPRKTKPAATAKPAPVVVKQGPVAPPLKPPRQPSPPPRSPSPPSLARLDLTTPSDSDDDSAHSPRQSPPGYEPPSEGMSSLTKGALILGAFAGAFLLGQHLVKSAVPVDAGLHAPIHSTQSARAPVLGDRSPSPERHESAQGRISKAEIQSAARRKPLSEASLKNAGAPSPSP